ncbi:MAG: molybdopterin-dependent oxidoreductase [Candidatus Eremiobacteraeota bacterium]|nr:molybdopterin-dependent oxidoreductase [Candidatus Eremiobacteraeota bacterium]
MKRRLFIASSLSAALAGCGAIGTRLNDSRFHDVLNSAEALNHALLGTRGLAKEYAESDIDWNFRVNGFDTPMDSAYATLMNGNYRAYHLIVDGAVERPQRLALAQLRSMPLQTNITRHDCVEGWSAIGKFRGVRLRDVLDLAQPRTQARYVIFHCMDRSPEGLPYYESLNLHQARHPQALLVLDLNDRPIDADHGAPLRLRVPTQLGYKSAKWVARIEVVASFATIFSGNGGYWEDQGYEWYAGI